MQSLSFDTLYVGTTLQDIMHVYRKAEEESVLFTDYHLGTTCTAGALETCGCAQSVDILSSASERHRSLPVETYITLVRAHDAFSSVVLECRAEHLLSFVRIDALFCCSKDREVRLPQTREELALFGEIPPEDKLGLWELSTCSSVCSADSFEESPLFSIWNTFSEKGKSFFLSGIIGEEKITQDGLQLLKMYIDSLGGPQFLFPTESLSSLSLLAGTLGQLDRLRFFPSPRSLYAPTPSFHREDSKCHRVEIPDLEEDIYVGRIIQEKRKYFQYNQVLILSASPVEETPSKYIYSTGTSYVHGLHLKLHSVFYLYLWSTQEIPNLKLIPSLKICENRVLFNAKLFSESNTKWYTSEV
ncbi:hypothetical protein NECID01_1654 [Nematocida sp. AWRm77]|nr:hypothetical protein NECID01_1654 [Nematocida sp. AWRm77]